MVKIPFVAFGIKLPFDFILIFLPCKNLKTNIDLGLHFLIRSFKFQVVYFNAHSSLFKSQYPCDLAIYKTIFNFKVQMLYPQKGLGEYWHTQTHGNTLDTLRILLFLIV